MGKGFEFKIRYIKMTPMPEICKDNLAIVGKLENIDVYDNKVNALIYKYYRLSKDEMKIIECA